MRIHHILLPIALLLLPAAAHAAAAPATFMVCETQQELEQVLNSKGQFVPDGCRQVRVPVVETTSGRLCVIDFSQPDPGLVGSLQEMASTSRWWTDCANLRGIEPEQAQTR